MVVCPGIRRFASSALAFAVAGTLLSCGEETTEPLGDFVVAEYAELPVCDDLQTGAKARVEAFDLNFFCDGGQWVSEDSVALQCRLAGHLVDLRDEPSAKCDSDGILRDPRNGREYRCGEAGGSVWMLDNLAFGTLADSTKGLGDPNNWCEARKHCDGNDTLCAAGGKYSRTTALLLDSGGDDYLRSDAVGEPHQGLCPVGWHVPTMTEFEAAQADLAARGLLGETSGNAATRGAWSARSFVLNRMGSIVRCELCAATAEKTDCTLRADAEARLRCVQD